MNKKATDQKKVRAQEMNEIVLMESLASERDCVKRSQTGLEVTQSFVILLLAVGEPALFLTPAFCPRENVGSLIVFDLLPRRSL